VTATVLVFGRGGQLARELARIGAPTGLELAFAGREDFDLSTHDPASLIAARAPDAVINASAYTAVDKAETEPAAAFRLNRDAPAALARACAARDIPFVHVSTDYVFDGTKAEPYVEEDPVNPMGVYGRSKAEGEAGVLAAGGRAAILRTSWVFGAFGSNFVKTMLGLAATRDELAVVADQIGRPTWAKDLADGALRATTALLDRDAGAEGLFHLTGSGEAVSWADFAEAIFEESARRGGPSAAVRRITTAQFAADRPGMAPRPANSRLDCSKLVGALNWATPDWRESLAACCSELETNPT